MKLQPEKPKRRVWLRLGYGVLGPLATVIALYLFVFLAANSHVGSNWIKEQVNGALPGSLDFEYVEIRPTLNRVHAWGVQVFDPTGEEVIRLRRLNCTIDLTGMLFNRFELSRCEATRGRVLVGVKPDGSLGIVQAFSRDVRVKKPLDEQPALIFDGVTVRDVDVLINLDDLMLRFDAAQTEDAYLSADEDGFYMKTERLESARGRWIFSERLLGFGPGKSNLQTLAWSALRMLAPWKAAYVEYPPPAEGRRGVLDVPLHSLDLRGLTWKREAIEFDEGYIRVADVTIAGSAWLEFIPERPRLAPTEAGVINYDGEATVHFTPDSPVLDFFLPGMISTATDGHAESALKPLHFDGYGNIRIFDGSTEVHARKLNVLGWELDRLDGRVAIRAGRLGFDGIATAKLWGGTVTGTGWIEPNNGAWGAELCVNDVSLAKFLDAFPSIEIPSDLRAGRLTTSPSRCRPGRQAPVTMSGNLTAKALFQLAPARETRATNMIEDTMWRMNLRNVLVRWPRSPRGIPGETARISGTGRLDQRGVVHVPAEAGERPLYVHADGDAARFIGAIDVIDGGLSDASFGFETPEARKWLYDYGLTFVPTGVRLETNLQLSGSVFNPRLESGWFEADRTLSDEQSPDFVLSATLRRVGNLHVVENFSTESSAGSVDVAGTLSLFDDGLFTLRRDPSADLRIRARDLRLDRLPLDLPVSTTVERFDATWKGSLRRPDARATLVAGRGFVGGEPFNAASTAIAWDGRVLTFSDSELTKGSGTITGNVAIDTVRKEVDGSIRGANFRLSDLQTLVAAGLSPSGRARFALDFRGSLNRPRLYGSVVVDRLRVLDRTIGTTSFVVDTWDGAVQATGTFNGLVDAAVKYVHGDDKITVASSFHHLPLGRLLPALGGSFGRSWISGSFDTEIRPGETLSLDTSFELRDAQLNAGARRFHLDAPATATLSVDEGFAYTIEPFTLSDGERSLRVSGRRARDGQVDAAVDGELDLALLQLFPSLIADATGDARVDVRIGGTRDKLRADGDIELRDVELTPRGLGTTVRFDDGLIELDGDRLVIPASQPMHGQIYGGDLILSGVLGFEGLRPGELVLDTNFTGATYRIPKQLVLTLNGNVRITNEDMSAPRGWAVAGDVEILDGRFYRNFDIFSDIFSLGGIGRTVSTFEAPIWIQNPDIGAIDLDLAVTGRDRLFVVSSISSVELALEMKTDLSIKGPMAAMEVEGEMETLENSRVLYSGRRFDVEDGVLLFTGYRDEQGFPWPQVDMEMETEIRSTCASRRRGTLDTSSSTDEVGRRVEESESIFITMNVQGRLPVDLTFALESTPFYDQRDQLSLVLTGCPVDALTGGSGAGPTLEIVFRPVIDIVERNVEDRFNLDDVDLVPTPEGSAEILVEDEISERLVWTLNARVGTDEASRQTVTGRYSLFDWMIFELLERTEGDEPLTIDGGVRFRVRLN